MYTVNKYYTVDDTRENEVKQSSAQSKLCGPQYRYEAEMCTDGTILSLYRADKNYNYEEYIIGSGWRNTVEAIEIFNGYHHPHSVSEEEAEQHVKSLEKYLKNNGIDES